ncbi:MAG TPA: hypothetical protein VJM31_02995 [Vicinamibacterales bacterium]|nr:hypothetical protein [Vicinamibacterales bacterium]
MSILLMGSPMQGEAQTRSGTVKPAPPVARKLTTAPADLMCPAPLGPGITSKLAYCDVLTGRDPKAGIIIKLPARRGPVTLKFNLHNRHTYSEEEVRMKRAYASYTASIGVLTLDNTLLTRAVVASEFRKLDDLVERIGGGAGPGGVKAVGPVGSEAISVEIAAGVTEVSLLGEKLSVVRADGVPANYSAPGRPIAVISNVIVEYAPAPAPARRRR